MKNKFTAILGVAVLLLFGQRAFTQTTPPVQVLGPAQGFAPMPSPVMSPDQILGPLQEAIRTQGQRQFDMNMLLLQQAFAAQQQQRQLQTDAAAQQRQLQAQQVTGYPTTTVSNPFSQFYQDRAGASITNALPYSGNTKIFTLATTTTNDINELYRNGYWLIGVSAFQGPPQSQDAVMVQAKKVGADVVLLSSANLGSQQVAVDQYQYEAGFFKKTKTPILGIIGAPLPSEIRQQLERNTGVFVVIVINNSPAFNANILEGDVILKMNGEDVMSVADLSKKNVTFVGQKVDVEIWRRGQFKTISVQLNNAQTAGNALPNPTTTPQIPVQPQVPDEGNADQSIKPDLFAMMMSGKADQILQGKADQSGPRLPQGQIAGSEFDEQKKLAENGNAAAQRFEGIYSLGGSTADATPDYVEAAKWFRKAADQNDVFSEVCLGDLYANGNGVPQDYPEALKWYRKAADQGYALAQYDLGCYYEIGKGVAKDEVEAAKWFRKAADQGNAAAQYSLGYCYCKGGGVDTNAVEGYKWCSLASTQGSEPAKKILAILEQRMTPEHIAEGQRLAREFKPHMESASDNSK